MLVKMVVFVLVLVGLSLVLGFYILIRIYEQYRKQRVMDNDQ